MASKEEVDGMMKLVEEQGILVRGLKSPESNSTKEDLDTAIAKLLELKLQLSKMTGEELKPKGKKNKKNKADKKEQKAQVK